MDDNTATMIVFLAFFAMCALIAWAHAWENVRLGERPERTWTQTLLDDQPPSEDDQPAKLL